MSNSAKKAKKKLTLSNRSPIFNPAASEVEFKFSTKIPILFPPQIPNPIGSWGCLVMFMVGLEVITDDELKI